MANLNFKGKSAVWNHHLSVPYRVLEKDKKLSSKGKNEDENLIIEADNLWALKSLLPKYQGKIKCIYIDPPYNTGNEGWVYSDNVNSPIIKEWLREGPVGTDDLTRHDKWLCMMTPRLKLLRELLSDDGVIFVSINDNEVANLRNLMDEIFIENNFVANLIWMNKEGGGSSDSAHFKVKHEYILCFAKDKTQLNINQSIVESDVDYTFKDKYEKERGKYKMIKLNSFSIQYSASLDYPISSPDKTKIFPSENGKKGCWRWSKKKLEWGLENDFIEFRKDKNDNWIVYTKQYFKVDNENKPIVRSLPPLAIIDKFSSTMASKQLEELMGGAKIFEYSKPYPLIQYLAKLSTDENDLILDSFAGSGTTAQAVLELNEEDRKNGKEANRKFILVQLPEETKKDSPARKAGFKFVHEITRERVARVIKKIAKESGQKTETGFSYLKLGPKIDTEELLIGKLPSYKELAKYVFYLATGKILENEKIIDEKKYFVGKNASESIYLIYEKDREKLKNLALDLDFVEKTKNDKNKKIVYAPACFLDDEISEANNISFVNIPYGLQ